MEARVHGGGCSANVTVQVLQCIRSVLCVMRNPSTTLFFPQLPPVQLAQPNPDISAPQKRQIWTLSSTLSRSPPLISTTHHRQGRHRRLHRDEAEMCIAHPPVTRHPLPVARRPFTSSLCSTVQYSTVQYTVWLSLGVRWRYSRDGDQQ